MKIRKLALVGVSFTLAVAGLSACSSILNPTASGSITIYSNSISDGRGDWLKKEAKEAGFNLNLVDSGGGDVYNKIVAEKDNPVADMFFGLNDIFGHNLAEKNLLEEYKPAWADEVDTKGAGDAKTYWPIVREPIMLVCNTAKYPTADQMPKDWPDLWENPKFKKRYETPAVLGGGTTQVVLSSILSRYPDQNGKLSVSDKGWEAIKSFFDNGSRAVDGTDLYARMSQGNVDCGQMWLAGKITREKQYGVSTEAARPAGGVPILHQFTGVVKGAKNAEGAKKFIDWFGSAEMQGKWSKQFGTAPMNKKAEGDSKVVKYTDSFAQQNIDWRFVAKNLTSWIEEIQLKYAK